MFVWCVLLVLLSPCYPRPWGKRSIEDKLDKFEAFKRVTKTKYNNFFEEHLAFMEFGKALDRNKEEEVLERRRRIVQQVGYNELQIRLW